MKVAIVAFNNIKYSPYVKTYSNYLDKKGISYDVIIPNRDGIEETLGEKFYAISWNKNKGKVYNFLKFTREAKKILKKNKYDFLFVLTTMPAVLLSGVLTSRYKNRYLVDIRDYTHEKVSLYYQIESKVLKNAALRVISSYGFKNFLPELDYLMCHNTSYNFENAAKQFDKKTDGKIIIGYVGTIAYVNRCKELIELVKKDERFAFHLYGNENHGTVIKDLVSELGCDRICYFGSYMPSDKERILNSVDILFNVYGNSTPLVKYALSNKLYDSFYFKKPLLTSPDTDMSYQAGEFSFDIDSNTASLDGLFDWYNSIDSENMIAYMNKRLDEYFAEMQLFNETLGGIFEKN